MAADKQSDRFPTAHLSGNLGIITYNTAGKMLEIADTAVFQNDIVFQMGILNYGTSTYAGIWPDI
jgi:hypothetical protein